MRIKWNIKGFEELRRAPGVAADVDSRASRVAAAAGNGYVASPYEGKSRHRASVFTQTPRAMVDSQKNNTLLRSLDAGR